MATATRPPQPIQSAAATRATARVVSVMCALGVATTSHFDRFLRSPKGSVVENLTLGDGQDRDQQDIRGRIAAPAPGLDLGTAAPPEAGSQQLVAIDDDGHLGIPGA